MTIRLLSVDKFFDLSLAKAPILNLNFYSNSTISKDSNNPLFFK